MGAMFGPLFLEHLGVVALGALIAVGIMGTALAVIAWQLGRKE